MTHLYGAALLYVYFFQTAFKLIDKIRDGAITVKRYSQPTAPCDRLIQHDATGGKVKAPLGEYRAGLDPVAFLHTIRAAQSALVAVTAPGIRETPAGASRGRFLAKVPNMWRKGEARPTQAARLRAPRHCRTLKDPFEGIWGDVLVWLQAEPDTKGKALMAILRVEHPDRFTEAHLRTMQRIVKEWREMMAKKLFYAATDADSAEPNGLPGVVLVGAGPKY